MGKQLVLALMLAVAACGGPAPSAGTVAQPAKWSDYSYAKEGFAVSAPKEPTFSTKTVETAAGPGWETAC